MEKKLRNYSTPIIARIQNERVLIDVRCLTYEDMVVVQSACAGVGEGAIL